MSLGYGAPLFDQLSSSLSSGYTPPSWDAINKTIDRSGVVYGAPDFDHLSSYLNGGYSTPSWDLINTVLQFPEGATQNIFAVGFSSKVFGTPVIGYNRTIYAYRVDPSWDDLKGLAASGYVAPIYNHLYGLVYSPHPPLLNATLWGNANVTNQYQNINASGFVSLVTGYGAVRNSAQPVLASGINAFSSGTPVIELSNREIYPAGINAFAGFGASWVSLYTRRVEVVGAGLQIAFGVPTISSGIRNVDLAGNGIASLTVGIPTLWFYLRQLFPQGYIALLPGTPKVDHSHPVYPVGFGGEVLGTPEVHRQRFIVDLAGLGIAPPGFGQATISNWWQMVFPPGIAGAGQTEVDRFGRPEVYNLTQYVRQLFVVTPSDGGVFGSPIHMTVENRNKVLRPDGIHVFGFGTPSVSNNARIVKTPAFVDFSLFGRQLVAYRIRTVYPQGSDTSQWGSRVNTIIYNAARQLFPAGWSGFAAGTAFFFANRQFLKQVGIDQSLFGTPMVDFAIRTLKPFGIPGDFPFGLTKVSNYQRFLQPLGLDAGGRGVPTLEIHFTIIKPSSTLPPSNQVGGGGRVHNVTPELHQQGAVMTLWGRPAIHNQFEAYNFQGWGSMIFGRHVIEFRTKTIPVKGWNSFTMPTTHHVYKALPDPPGARTLGVSGSPMSSIGQPLVWTNVLRPGGFVGTSYGTPKVVSNGILPIGITPPYGDNGTQFGTPTIPRAIYTYPKGAETVLWGIPDFGPHYVWAPHGYPYPTGYQTELGELMDNRFIGNNDPTRPFFGKAIVTLKNRRITTSMDYVMTVYGQPFVTQRPRYLRMNGTKFQKFGIPVLNGGGGAQAYGFEMTLWGSPGLSFPPYTGPQTVAPYGLAAGSWGNAWVANWIRNIYPQGWLEFTVSSPVPPSWPRASTWVSLAYDPFPFVGSDMANYGVPWVSFRVRSIFPVGEDTALVAEYSPGSFTDRMRVRKQDRLTGLTSGSTGGIGRPTIGLRDRGVRVWGNDMLALGRFTVRRQNRVNVAGWLDELFGDVQRWEADRVKPQGFDTSLFGAGRVRSVVQPEGWEGKVGTPSVSPRIHAIGIGTFDLGFPTLIANVCGTRAINATSIQAGNVGVPEVSA